MKSTQNSGYTLIELLMVVSIIGFLSTAAMVSYQETRAISLSTSKIGDLQAMQKALELYYANNSHYPTVTLAADYPNYISIADGDAAAWNQLQTLLSPYIATLPVSANPDRPYIYVAGGNSSVCVYHWSGHFTVQSNQQGFAIIAQLGGGSDYLAAGDGGSLQYYYERYGGNFSIGAGPCP